jgi:IS5 family transposase
MIKRRSAIEPTIGHMKTDGRLARNPLKGALGDALHAVLCGAGHNVRLLLKTPQLLFTFIVWAISGSRAVNHGAHQLAVG